MPSVNDFKNKKKKPKSQRTNPILNLNKTNPTAEAPHAMKRRPGREPAETTTENENGSPQMSEEKHEEHHEAAGEQSHETQDKVEINFPGSELLRAKMPKPFAVADQVATEWKNDGSFEALPLGHPLAQMLAATGLRKAKDFEKKVVESGVVEKLAFQALSLGMKAQQEIQNIREQVKTKLGKK